MGIEKAQIKSLTKKELSRLFVRDGLNIILQTINVTGEDRFVIDFFVNKHQLKHLQNMGYEVYN